MNSPNDLLAALLALAAATLMLLAAVGVVRMPDVFTRMQASAKAASLGSGLALLAAALHFAELSVVVRAVLAIAFIFLTAPISAHMITRAAYFMGVELWEKTVVDDLDGRYDRAEHRLDSPPWAKRSVK
ncbi:MAG TPA: monovalent cation/H(+) antiporter subunit G [Candidatus Limnocylindrales bacterium]|jgi:multicomponent Na+:H+ antiporter subunit G|nr:monovalent cation/H(+) antiporter subunit G [Candidatus Limnocylindrales bacterium]